MKILLYEHVSGGGYAGKPLDQSVLSEGFGMLRCLAQDFKAAGNEVTVLLDERIAKMKPPLAAKSTVLVFPAQGVEKSLVNAAKTNDAVYVIAPETGQILQSLVTLVGKTSKVALNCEASAIGNVADKAVLYETLKNNDLCTPETVTFDVEKDLAQVEREIRSQLSYPVVIKPVDGVSCGGLSIIHEDRLLETAIEKIKATSSAKICIAQEFVCGETASVSLICKKDKALSVSLNKQIVNLSEPEGASSYEGGAVPFDHPLKAEAFKAAEKVASCFVGLRGYVGVDFVLAQGRAFVVDVNPRLTTSYVGLSKVAGFNMAEAMVHAVLDNKFLVKQENKGFVYFSKVRFSKPSIDVFSKVAQIDGVTSPPFPLDGESEAISLVAAHGKSMSDAELQFEEAKKRLLKIISGGR
ncbi:MAG TPA: ATP-grasp domain-containing protein [Candidatus Bathyarchaeia archaeon]|nr:ATP-grasp domain-containing protein [Candidatus Bathyarchaeia archaeon]